MTRKSLITMAILLVSLVALLSAGTADNCQPIDRKQLKDIMVQLGYVVKDIVTDPGKEKYSVMLTRDGLDIPVSAEISANNEFVWLTVNLGPAKPDDGVRNFSMLKQNGIIQPCQFYVTSSGLQMMGLPIKNIGVGNAVLREKIESISGRVGETKALWKN